MPLDQKVVRKAGSLAFFALKKYKLYDSKTEGDLTTLSLFGDTYQFFFDKGRKLTWMVSKHHYQDSRTFKLATRHRDWEGIFSFPRAKVADEMAKHFQTVGMPPKGLEESRQLGIQYRIVASQVYKADKSKLARVFGGILWKHLDYEMACLGIKVFGLGVHSIDYSLIWNNKEEIVDTLNKAPGVLPLWRDIVLMKMYRDRKCKTPKKRTQRENDWIESLRDVDETAEVGLRDVDEHMEATHPSQIINNFDYPNEIDNFSHPNIIQTVKETLDKQGLTTAGWRYLIKLPPRFMSRIIRCAGGRDIAPIMNWMAAIGMVPRYTILKPLLENTGLYERTEELLAVLRAGVKEASKSKAIREFWAGQFHLVLDWFVNGQEHRHVAIRDDFWSSATRRYWHGSITTSQVALDHNQMKAPWSWFMRQQEEWHRQAAKIAKDKVKQQTWDSALGEIEVKGYQIIPLVDAHALVDEGKDMHNCVGNYAHRCISGESRIFSIRRNGAKIATMELLNRNSLTCDYNYAAAGGGLRLSASWSVNQIRGVCNANASPEIKKIAETVARQYNKALGQHFAEAV